jgi:hypothetical protein
MSKSPAALSGPSLLKRSQQLKVVGIFTAQRSSSAAINNSLVSRGRDVDGKAINRKTRCRGQA